MCVWSVHAGALVWMWYNSRSSLVCLRLARPEARPVSCRIGIYSGKVTMHNTVHTRGSAARTARAASTYRPGSITKQTRQQRADAVAKRMRALRQKATQKLIRSSVMPAEPSPKNSHTISAQEILSTQPALASPEMSALITPELEQSYARDMYDELARVWKKPYGVAGKQDCKIEIRLTPQATIDHLAVITSSGNILYDMSLCAALRSCRFPQGLSGKHFIIVCPMDSWSPDQGFLVEVQPGQ